jgi:putative transposase
MSYLQVTESRFWYAASWPTCRRSELLVGEVAARLRELLEQVAVENGWRVLALDIRPAQVAIRLETDAGISPHRLVRTLKAATSPILRDEFPHLCRLPSLWTREYRAATVTPNPREEV